MATNFKLRYSGRVIPTEEVALADGTTISYNVHSTIDKILGSSITKDYGTASTEVIYDTYLTTTSGVALSAAAILNTNPTVGFLFIKIASAGSTGTPYVNIAMDITPNYRIALEGVGDFCMIPFDTNLNAITASEITIMSPSASTVANIEILVGKL